MAKNSFEISRVAFGKFTMPSNTAANTASTLTCATGAFIPKGALITGISWFVGGAMTEIASMKNGTINVYAGGQALGTNNRIASAALVQTSLGSHAVAAGQYVSVGGPLIVQFASSDNARSGIVVDGDVYVEYLYCNDKDA